RRRDDLDARDRRPVGERLHPRGQDRRARVTGVRTTMRYLLALAMLACALVPASAQDTPQQPALPKTSDKVVLDRARVLKRPVYPDDARGDGLDGTVAVRLLLSPDGQVISARAVSGPEPLREAAAKAAEAWEFASTELPDNVVGFLLFRFNTA